MLYSDTLTLYDDISTLYPYASILHADILFYDTLSLHADILTLLADTSSLHDDISTLYMLILLFRKKGVSKNDFGLMKQLKCLYCLTWNICLHA